ncbi:MAG TPA: SH3 domain-containing protein [Sphingomicrobium sp.]|nr:SH3 domain-containing protein [Sphingomicrobium sp.]
MIASHYAEPLSRQLRNAAILRAQPAVESEALAELAAGDELRMLDCSRGWAWGYAPDGRVGYVPAEAVGA